MPGGGGGGGGTAASWTPELEEIRARLAALEAPADAEEEEERPGDEEAAVYPGDMLLLGGQYPEQAAITVRRKSVNTNELVPVPSSEHVAEIVGRQGECARGGDNGGHGDVIDKQGEG